MLASLSIRDVVLIDSLDLDFEEGLCALTGETGAGKSILLDSLGLALGQRAEGRLLRPGADRASVTAGFHLPAAHPAFAILEDLGLAARAARESREEGHLILRRVLREDGRSRAFVNDEPVSISALRRLGDSLIEIQGQFDQHGLLDPVSHRRLLDAFGGLGTRGGDLAALWRQSQAAAKAYGEAEEEILQAQREEAFLRHAVGELEGLAPQAGEAAALEERRALLKDKTRLIGAVDEALHALDGDEGALFRLGLAQRALPDGAERQSVALRLATDALARAEAEIGEAEAALGVLLRSFDEENDTLETVEARFFALHDMARKHRCDPEALPELLADFQRRLLALDSGSAQLERLARAKTEAWQAFAAAARALSDARRAAAKDFDLAVLRELPALKLERARFETRVEPLEEARWGPSGGDAVAFLVATNPGGEAGHLGRIASGGELSRFLLAIKVALAGEEDGRAQVFDEVDSGIGGATADAVGERLARLAAQHQILVVTHSPQVAARADHHWLVSKLSDGETSRTTVRRLEPDARREEIARMLSGAEVTQEARAAAARLMGAA